jgi:hypothetical protein
VKLSAEGMVNLNQKAKEIAGRYPKPVDITLRPLSPQLNEAIRGLELQSSPGALWSGTSNDDILKTRRHEIEDAVIALYYYLSQVDITGMSAAEVFKTTGIAYKMFIKDEFHSTDKAKQKRWRLIFSNPIVLNILERFVFGPTLDAEKVGDTYMKIPTTIGLVMSGPEKREESLRLKAKVREFVGECIASTDASGWDWTVSDWLYQAANYRYAGTSPEFQMITRNLLHIAMNKTVCFSDGLLYSQDTPGVVPSGGYQTGSLNSYLRALLRSLIDGHYPVTMGDDCLEKHLEGLTELYRTLGFTIKYSGVPSKLGEFEFCSKLFRNGGVVPVVSSVEKMLLNAWKTRDPQVISSLREELEEAEHYTSIIPMVLNAGLEK